MLWSPASPSPLLDPPSSVVEDTSVHTGTACLALMDQATTAQVWEDLLLDGHDHSHGAGGLMFNAASLGTHFDYDGDFPVRLHRSITGQAIALLVHLDPYGEDLDTADHPADHAHEHGATPDTGHGRHADGWTEPERVDLVSAHAVLGDPAGLPEADDTGGLLDLQWPASGGHLLASVLTEGGRRRYLALLWRP
jgi:hypothetical protein